MVRIEVVSPLGIDTDRSARLREALRLEHCVVVPGSGAQADPRRLDATRSLIPGTERVTAADVRRAAQSVLRDDNMWMLEVRPVAAK